MTERRLNFIKGHMGGNEIVLLYGDQLSYVDELPVAISVLNPPNIRGHNAGVLYDARNTDIKVKIIDVTLEDYITMCGGLTQVFGKAIIETDLAERFNIEIGESPTSLTLETDAGSIPLQIFHSDDKAEKVYTNMKSFVDQCYSLGIEPMKLANINAMKVGDFLVINTDEIKKVNQSVDFEEIGENTLQMLKQVQREFDKRVNRESAEFALYDQHSRCYDGRLLFPHRISKGHIEPSCGTGTVAVGLAMVAREELQNKEEITFESGGSPYAIGGPSLTNLDLTIEDGVVKDASFCHSLIQLIASGIIFAH